jgi:hypothetical protein
MSQIIALDTNLIILLIVGLADETVVPKHKRTRAYTTQDFKLLSNIVAGYREIAVVPNALSEVSNLLSFEADELSRKILANFSRFISNTREFYITSLDASKRHEFRWLGLSDSAILELAKRETDILTSDVDLHIAALRAGYNSFNFTHMIDAARA